MIRINVDQGLCGDRPRNSQAKACAHAFSTGNDNFPYKSDDKFSEKRIYQKTCNRKGHFIIMRRSSAAKLIVPLGLVLKRGVLYYLS